MKNLTINTVEQLTALLNLVSEAITKEDVSDEKNIQADISDELEDYRASKGSDKEENLRDDEVEEAEDDSEKSGDKDKKPVTDDAKDVKPKKDLTKLGSADPTPDKPSIPSSKEVVGANLGTVVKNLNKIRSGKSLKDEMTKRELNDYLKSLNDGERQSLFVFLDGLSQIMAGGVPGSKAPDPGAVGITIKATTKIKEPEEKKSVPTPSTSKTSPALSKSAGEAKPIIVGEVANKDEIKNILQVLMRD